MSNKLDINVLDDMMKEFAIESSVTTFPKMTDEERDALVAKRKQEEAEHKASFKTEAVKKRVKWLLKVFSNNCDLDYDEYLTDGFNDSYDAENFLMDLIEAGGIKKNILIALMDKKSFFAPLDNAIDDEDGDAHEEWWYGGQAQAEGFW